MKKKTTKQIDRVLLWLAIASLIITFIEGLFYYSVEKYPNPLFRCLLIIQNSIRAFTFKTDISLKDIAGILQGNPSQAEQIVGYLYTAAVFAAPYCTLKVIYKVLDKVFRFRNWGLFSKKQRVVVFGYNPETKALISEEIKDRKSSKYRIHLVSPDLSENEEINLMRKGVIVHSVDCLQLDDKQLEYFFKQMELPKARQIVLFNESSAQNFSLYKLFHEDTAKSALNRDVKFFCRCENQSVRQILEDYHDKNKGRDLEVISTPELRVRKMLKEHSLHGFYEESNVPVSEWHLHLLIIGFGKLGQELLLQAMNMGVASSTNRILIDVIDFKMEERKNIFANNFNEHYVELGENEFSIPSDRADGSFVVRFHQADIRHKQFHEQLMKYGDAGKDGVYTYIAICVEDEDVGLHTMCEAQRYLDCVGSRENTVVGIRMELDRQMAGYLDDNKETYRNVFPILDNSAVITLEDLLHEEVDREAKEFNRIYNSIHIQHSSEPAPSDPQEERPGKEELEKEANEYWRALKLFRRNSSRALAQHAKVKETVFERLEYEDLEALFGKDGTMLKKVGNVWSYGDLDHFVKAQNDRDKHPCVSEMSRLEHRRWCYFMASCGWRRTEPGDEQKEKTELEREKKNICMCTWDELVKCRKDTCQYDLMWLLQKYIAESDGAAKH